MANIIYVSNLARTVDSSVLEGIFSRVGNVERAVVVLDESTGESSGNGYVEMSTDEEAANCLDRFSGLVEHGRALVVTHIQARRVEKKVPQVNKIKAIRESLKAKRRR